VAAGMQAIVYFQRALKLNPGCLDAWCLVGHEFLELKNHHGAIEAYRRAVATDPRDVRSWYSLGQAYEMMQMPYYALFYYRKAAQLTPDDARMWVRTLSLVLKQCQFDNQRV
jgi:anaphase-promoting complex subunit 8